METGKKERRGLIYVKTSQTIGTPRTSDTGPKVAVSLSNRMQR